MLAANDFEEPPIILVDMDDTIAHLTPTVLDLWLQGAKGRRLPRRAQDTYFAQDWIGERYRDSLNAMFDTPGLFALLKPIDGAVDALHEMDANGYRVILCSTPQVTNPNCASDKISWVTEHLGPKFATNTALIHDKSLVYGDVLIDDRPNPIMTMNPSWTHVLFHQSYNAFAPNPRITDWSKWRDVVDPILSLRGHKTFAHA